MVFVVVPSYNEEKKIGRVVRGLFEHGFNSVVVVDDGSTDNTFLEAQKNGAIVLKHSINRGQGAGLQTGNEFALSQGADYIVHFDGDGQFNPQDIITALKLLKEKQVEVVLGSRFLDNRSRLPWFKKYILLPIARLINFLLTGVRLSDAHNGFRIFTANSARKIIITQDKMAHNTEIIAQIKKQGLKFVECPVEVVYNEYGQRAGAGFKILWDLFTRKFYK